jgi:2-keto-4-pentenoate hydratase/2-oxohepta-3-ene-1,7-dioic acid hydratase in catechol pathway
MKRFLKIVGGLAAIGFIGLLVRSIQVSQPLFDENIAEVPNEALQVAPLSDAITLAKSQQGDVLLVVAASLDGVLAVNLTEAMALPDTDTLDLYLAVGPSEIRETLDQETMSFSWEELGLPYQAQPQAIAAGTNFAAHAAEVGLEEGPFLFPKFSAASPWNAPLEKSARLDYEVELCAVPLSDYTADAPAPLGLVLCNDFTDRWDLVRTIDLDGVLGKTGFADGKSGEGRLPVGALLVIPNDFNAFINKVALGLAVNGELRQRGQGDQMIWNAERVLTEALKDCANDYHYQGRLASLGSCGKVAAGTTIMLGTPDGVSFQMPNIWMPWAYLRGGDEVLTYASSLGYLKTKIQ